MSVGINYPSVAQLASIASGFGLDMTESEVLEYRDLMGAMVRYCREIEQMAEPIPAVKYPRNPGFRPVGEENPYNAWYWRTEIAGAKEGPLSGYIVGVKDAICVAGVPAMNGSRILEGYVPTVDATVVTRLLDAGAVIVGKTSTDDLCMAGTGHTCALGPVKNPRRPTHATGGSSAGSAAALAAGDVRLALGGDQGGSIRIPAAWCGVVGLKPTYGLVPYTGCMMMEMTLDHVGPMARTVADCAAMLSVIAGPDGQDPRQRGAIPDTYDRDYGSAIEKDINTIRIGIVREGFSHRWPEPGLPESDEAVDSRVRAACSVFERLGATVEEVSIPLHLAGVAIYSVLFQQGTLEFMIKGNGLGTNWAGYYNTGLGDAFARGLSSRPNDLPPSVKLLMLSAEYLKKFYHGRYYGKAQNLRENLRRAYDRVLNSYDVLVMPTVPYLPIKIPEPGCSTTVEVRAGGTQIGNVCQACLTGHPSITVPCGEVDGLPVGLMITGRHFEDATVLRVASAFEKAHA
ncbi:amidase [Mesorhizobium silamurunense]|uniref:amidase n=1 Tax=Mesorhizobium silamurunense TaxID=499528 RepID=UPI0017854A2F|nr:amidase [Mesorhizobium silamurunense]